MSLRKLPILLPFLLLRAGGALAQTQPPPSPDPDYEQVSVPVPRAVSLIADAASVLFSRNEDENKVQALVDRRRERSKKGDQSLRFTIPKNKLTRTLGLVE
ncbi:hypothetical protein GCM10028824_16750 [Hymenobacter segetis]|uniref:Uncharacterized protein n=1 Tax=Hymenobacter segetis TaxID=2025509 RepID=A0ABU9LQC6_9BACT